MSALTDLFTAFANKIRSKTGGSDTYTPPQMVNAIDDVYQAGVDAGTTPTQTKTVTAGTTATTVTPDTGYALSSVTVNPTPSQSKSATPSTTAQTITPDSGKLLSSVSVSAIQTQTKSATPSTSAQTITPDSGKYLTSVSVGAISTQTKSVTPSTTSQTVTPDSGKYLTSVSVGAISTETKTQAAGTSNIDVTPTSGKYLTKVTITPQQHSGYYPSSSTNITSNGTSDLGVSHNYRYIKVNVTPSLQSKSAGPNVSTNKTVSPDSGYDGLSQVTITPLSHTGYSPSSSTYTSLAMGESKSIDLGANHDKRYVRVQAAAPSGNKSITANGTGIDVASYSTVSVAVPDPTLSGDAAVGNVLSGKTFYNNSYTKQTGTMTNNGAVSPSGLDCDGSYTIPAGYHNGSGVVTANSLASQTGVDSGKTAVTAAKMFSGYQGWVNGSKVSGTYTAPIIEQIVPSDSQPVGLQVNSTYLAKASGYAIENSPTTLTPNDSDPPAIASGVIYKGGGAGFAVATKPTKTETTLWTNSSPTSTFANTTVTLSQSIENFDYIKFRIASTKSNTAESYQAESIFSVADVKRSTTTTYAPQCIISSRSTSGGQYVRRFLYESNTSLSISSGQQIAGTSGNNNYVIPLSIVGIKYTPESLK